MEQKTPHAKYYEGILQLREPTQDTIDFIYNAVDRQKKDWVRISQVKKVKGGIDFYLTSKKYLKTLGKKLLKHFGGILKESAQLYSRNHQTGKNIYRLNISFKPSPYKVKDIITLDNEVYQVTSLDKRIAATNLKTRKKCLLKYEETIKKLEPKKTMVTKVKPQLEILDPETYQSTPTKNTKKLKHGQNVKIVKHNNNIYLV
jgi:NMD protein affecting ribosome stability and mRNA decay